MKSDISLSIDGRMNCVVADNGDSFRMSFFLDDDRFNGPFSGHVQDGNLKFFFSPKRQKKFLLRHLSGQFQFTVTISECSSYKMLKCSWFSECIFTVTAVKFHFWKKDSIRGTSLVHYPARKKTPHLLHPKVCPFAGPRRWTIDQRGLN
jgi:hypothetical protein